MQPEDSKLAEAYEQLRQRYLEKNEKLRKWQRRHDGMATSLEYRFGKFLLQPVRWWQRTQQRWIQSFAKRLYPHLQRPFTQSSPNSGIYHRWWLKHQPTLLELACYEKESRRFSYRPKISILFPVYRTPIQDLRAALNSVCHQIYDNWELVIVDDASGDEKLSQELKLWLEKERRFRVKTLEKNAGIAQASQQALTLATGEFVGLLDHDDVLEPHALYEVVKLLNRESNADIIYSDEDKINEQNELEKPHWKPDWSPDTLLSCNYLCHFTVLRKSLLNEIGGFRSGFDGAQDYDLFLRATEKTSQIFHIPKILYHWRISPDSTASDTESKPYAALAGQRALTEACARRQIVGNVKVDFGTVYRVCREVNPLKKVTIIIPMRDGVELTHRCVESLAQKTNYPNYEIVIVDNGSETAEAKDWLNSISHRVLRYEKPFNYSAINNYAVEQTDGEWLLFLNNDTEIIEPDWLMAMVEQVQRPEIGAVGAQLLFPHSTIQHAGIVLGLAGAANHPFAQEKPNHAREIRMIRNWSAVTGACLMMRREVFQKVGGFDAQNFPIHYSDVDLCLRIRQAGFWIVCTPYAKLIHHESASRGYGALKNISQGFTQKWQALVENDPFYNPNLSRQKLDWSLKETE
ncbi:MAG: glycosyltransferase family 2 protein [Verrucomicrobiae bacterium]|nr:glycosyltransferase family 2 protein [Verrucomicrobiae bacterium]